MTKTYESPAAFKQALKARVKRRARKSGRGFNRMLQIALFERFLARVYDALGDAVILKGGFAMEVRLTRARSTKDIDLRVTGDLDELIDKLRKAAGTQAAEDYLSFALGDESTFDEMLGEQVVYDGRRIQVQAELAGNPFGQPFRLDLSVADRLLLPPDRVEGLDLFEFIGLDPLEHRVYPAESHVAEKLHAITLMHDSGRSSRAKDLVDIGLLAAHSTFVAGNLRRSIEATFEFRDTHDMPESLPAPPEFWKKLYDHIRSQDDLQWDNLKTLQADCSDFLDPILNESTGPESIWTPSSSSWVDEPD